MQVIRCGEELAGSILLTRPTRLERELCTQLQASVSIADSLAIGTSSACDVSKSRSQVSDVGIRVAEMRCIGNAEGLSLKFQSHALADRETAEHPCVEIEKSRSAQGVTGHITEYSIGDHRTACGKI